MFLTTGRRCTLWSFVAAFRLAPALFASRIYLISGHVYDIQWTELHFMSPTSIILPVQWNILLLNGCYQNVYHLADTAQACTSSNHVGLSSQSSLLLLPPLNFSLCFFFKNIPRLFSSLSLLYRPQPPPSSLTVRFLTSLAYICTFPLPRSPPVFYFYPIEGRADFSETTERTYHNAR